MGKIVKFDKIERLNQIENWTKLKIGMNWRFGQWKFDNFEKVDKMDKIENGTKLDKIENWKLD